MRERPILFSWPMVRAILDGRKTQTRRVVKLPRGAIGQIVVSSWDTRIAALRAHQPTVSDETLRLLQGERTPGPDLVIGLQGDDGYAVVSCPHGYPGDRLWVRETWSYDFGAVHSRDEQDGPFVYAADGDSRDRTLDGRWRPSIHIPRWASRITLEVTGVRVERLQDISGADAVAEGARASDAAVVIGGGKLRPDLNDTARGAFACLWDSINFDRGCGWEADPWVWVVEFRRVEVAS